ncbi:hypothetical protein CPB83DRAFT_896364 [Crepidotus variabilis]|uniref:Uncharacterized protein n=1 Tax=Crepidotus variabilis TaxID=179855 RepID=A0A9P6JN14_9AGAR|nr:hypothetical protein CPB83DRAFT_896364 [Crepidotus variabilis]
MNTRSTEKNKRKHTTSTKSADNATLKTDGRRKKTKPEAPITAPAQAASAQSTQATSSSHPMFQQAYPLGTIFPDSGTYHQWPMNYWPSYLSSGQQMSQSSPMGHHISTHQIYTSNQANPDTQVGQAPVTQVSLAPAAQVGLAPVAQASTSGDNPSMIPNHIEAALLNSQSQTVPIDPLLQAQSQVLPAPRPTSPNAAQSALEDPRSNITTQTSAKSLPTSSSPEKQNFTYAMTLAKTTDAKDITQKLTKELTDEKQMRQQAEEESKKLREELEKKNVDQALQLETYRAQLEAIGGISRQDRPDQ